MNQPLSRKIFGEIPEDFDALLMKACGHVPEAKRLKRPVHALVLALIILLLAGTALAALQGLKIVDLFGVGSVDEREAEMVIDTAIAQRGGKTGIADFTVSEAFYDGTFLRFVIESHTREEAVLLNAGFTMLKEGEETSGLPGTRYGVEASVAWPGIGETGYLAMRHSDGALYLYANRFMREESSAASVEVTVDIALLDIDSGSTVDSTTLSFTVHKTATPVTRTYDLALDTEYVRLEKVIVAKTPLEIVVSLEYTPLLRAFGSFTVVPSDGYVVKENRSYFFGNTGSLPDMANGGRTTVKYILPVEQGRENVLMLWVTNTDQAIVMDLDAGEAAACTVAVISEEDNVRIEKVED